MEDEKDFSSCKSEGFDRWHAIYLQQQAEFREALRRQNANSGKSDREIRQDMENPDVYTSPSKLNINLDNAGDVDIDL